MTRGQTNRIGFLMRDPQTALFFGGLMMIQQRANPSKPRRRSTVSQGPSRGACLSHPSHRRNYNPRLSDQRGPLPSCSAPLGERHDPALGHESTKITHSSSDFTLRYSGVNCKIRIHDHGNAAPHVSGAISEVPTKSHSRAVPLMHGVTPVRVWRALRLAIGGA